MTSRTFSRRTVLRGTAIVGAAVPFLGRQRADAASVSVGPRWLAFGGNPRHDMHITWVSGTANGAVVQPPAATVRYGRTKRYGVRRDADRCVQVPVRAGATALPDQNAFYSSVLLTGLEPGTKYHYAVSNDGQTWSPDATFRTAPKSPGRFRFTAFGDQGTIPGTLAAMTSLVAAQRPAFHLYPGDLAYATPEPEHYPNDTGFVPGAWDKYVRGIARHGAARIPWQISVGSHEIEPTGRQHGYSGFLTRFPQAHDHSSGTPTAHAFTYGNVAVIHLDGNEVSAQQTLNTGYSKGKQTAWLKRRLAEYRKAGSGIDFVVVVVNCCCYSTNQNHGSDGGLRDTWVPVFDKYHVDLVLSGHVHAYERTHPMHGGERTRKVASGGTVHPNRDGTTYICAGTGGNNLYPTWYGRSGGGDAGKPGSRPRVWRFSGGQTSTGETSGHPVDRVDAVTNFSAYRNASYAVVVVDITPPTSAGGQTSMHVRALRPAQRPGAVTSIRNPRVIDSVTLVRTSRV